MAQPDWALEEGRVVGEERDAGSSPTGTVGHVQEIARLDPVPGGGIMCVCMVFVCVFLLWKNIYNKSDHFTIFKCTVQYH